MRLAATVGRPGGEVGRGPAGAGPRVDLTGISPTSGQPAAYGLVVTLSRARRIALWALTLEVVTLAVTGAVLYFAYVPTATQAFGPGFPDAEGGEVAEVVRLVHRWASWLAVPTSLLVASLLTVRSRPSERVGRGLALGAGLVVAVLAASFTGYLLPWDQLALFSVTVGGNLSGYTWLGNDDVRFVLMNGTEIAPRTVLKWLVLHAIALGGTTAVLVALAWRRARAGAAADTDERSPREVPVGL